MEKKDFKPYLIEYLKDELDEETKKEIQSKLKVDLELQEELNEMQVVFGELNKVSIQKPDMQLKENFQKMMEENTAQAPGLFSSSISNIQNWINNFQVTISFKQMAYAAVLLLVGFFIGYNQNTGTIISGEKNQELSMEIEELRKNMMLTLLEQPSASERIKAVNISYDLEDADPKVIEALFFTLNNDKNSNVRLAALEALTRYSFNKKIRNGLTESLRHQNKPLIQIALIDVLTEMHDKSLKKEFNDLLQQGELDSDVKEKINESLEILM
ncbi:MAG: HEAT repeat domain-containing protein [Flammeovirgaceae bacterium]|nr:HEAT repeat domain-containing protein [Flammeovirgaceae bacterium]